MGVGILILKGKKKSLFVKFTNQKGKLVEMPAKEDELSKSLAHLKKANPDELINREVEFEEYQGQPKKIRELGQEFESSSSSSSNYVGDFHNPYNFVPALPRNTDRIQNSELGDRQPHSHGKYHPDLWSGTIKVKLTTKTPLLIPDAATAQEIKEGHKCYGIRRTPGDSNKPYLPPTEIKGMLRTAYEIVTNSRYSVFVDHDDKLAYRMNADNIKVLPARVQTDENNKDLILRILGEPKFVTGNRNQSNLAKLLRYQSDSSSPPRDKGESTVATRYEFSNNLPQHGEPVWVRVNRGKVTRIREWAVDRPGEGNNWNKGWVCVTGANAGEKKYERVFLESDDDLRLPLSDDIKLLWTELIANYQQLPKTQKYLDKRKENEVNPQDFFGDQPGEPAWSRHIFLESELELREGSLCYVEFDGRQIISVQPVIISRRLYNLEPTKLLDSYLQPASELKELSPAERVFGWVKLNSGKGENAAYKGNLRIGLVECQRHDAIKEFGENGFPLAILGQPQPQQARFYVANNKQGEPLTASQSQNQTAKPGYDTPKQGLRGRKVYPHHRSLPEEHWDLPNKTEELTTPNNGHFKEWHRYKPDDDPKDNQNRSIKAWVKPNTTFEFNIDVNNLSDVELGALLWLLDLPDEHYHRLGGAKPFGFGSVRLEIDPQFTDLKKGSEWKEYYSSLIPWQISHSFSEETQNTVTLFQQAVIDAYGNSRQFSQIEFIKAFCISAKGFDDNLPIHYPRIKETANSSEPVPPNFQGEGFNWFVANNRQSNPQSLPSLINDEGLPYLSQRQRR